MTVSTTTQTKRYVGTGANTPLATVFAFFKDSDVEVWRRIESTGVSTLLVRDTDYTVSGGGASGNQASSTGTVTPVDGVTNFLATDTWEIRRNIPILQTDFAVNEGDPFAALSVEGAFDRAVMQTQQLNKWVLLDQISSLGGVSGMFVHTPDNSAWTDIYDSVRLEFYGVFPTSAARMLVSVRDNGSASSSGLSSVVSTVKGSDSSTSIATTTDWGTDSTVLIDPDPESAVNGSITFHARDNKLFGSGQYVYRDSVSFGIAGASVYFVGSGPYTSLEGFHFEPTGGTFVGKFRFWGLPNR